MTNEFGLVEESCGGPVRVNFPVNTDARGALAELFNMKDLDALGIKGLGQANVSVTHDAGVVRGLHYQAPPSGQAKYLAVLSGAIESVAVDLREAEFGKVHRHHMEAFGPALWLPQGFAHGFQSLTANTVLIWFVTAPRDSARSFCIAYNDADLAISWPRPVRTDLLSMRDREGTPLGQHRGLNWPKADLSG
jgi:dTDP-4-dehydrorhamnose 3,5-epimerase